MNKSQIPGMIVAGTFIVPLLGLVAYQFKKDREKEKLHAPQPQPHLGPENWQALAKK